MPHPGLTNKCANPLHGGGSANTGDALVARATTILYTYIFLEKKIFEKGIETKQRIKHTHQSHLKGAAHVRHALPTKVLSSCLVPPLASEPTNLRKFSNKIAKTTITGGRDIHALPPQWCGHSVACITGLGFGQS